MGNFPKPKKFNNKKEEKNLTHRKHRRREGMCESGEEHKC